MAFEYDPYNKLRHTTYWYEYDSRAEWPLSKNAEEEEPPRDDLEFDFRAKPNKYYMEVETDGSLGAQEVVQKVRVCPNVPRLFPAYIPPLLPCAYIQVLTCLVTGSPRASD